MAVIPLADVGSQYSQGRLMGVAVALPRALELEREIAFRARLAGTEIESGIVGLWRAFEDVLASFDRLVLGNLGIWIVEQVSEPDKKSLQPERYSAKSRRWASVTPIALDRYPKAKDPEKWQEEVITTLSSTCANIGLPKPAGIAFSKHSAIQGAPSAYPSGNAPAWMGWTLPPAVRSRFLTHAVIEFADAVEGPVLLGAGPAYRSKGAGAVQCLGLKILMRSSGR
jgi:CRISPR-associated protein Csb2